jgi:hypothetical protein
MEKNNQLGANMAFNVNSKPFVPMGGNQVMQKEKKGK